MQHHKPGPLPREASTDPGLVVVVGLGVILVVLAAAVGFG
jgi:preprotein translocase subunit Sec61beta